MQTIALVSERLQLRLAVLSTWMPFMNYISQPETDRFNTLGIPENLEASKINATSFKKINKSILLIISLL
jgi:hypothetical protein